MHLNEITLKYQSTLEFESLFLLKVDKVRYGTFAKANKLCRAAVDLGRPYICDVTSIGHNWASHTYLCDITSIAHLWASHTYLCDVTSICHHWASHTYLCDVISIGQAIITLV